MIFLPFQNTSYAGVHAQSDGSSYTSAKQSSSAYATSASVNRFVSSGPSSSKSIAGYASVRASISKPWLPRSILFLNFVKRADIYRKHIVANMATKISLHTGSHSFPFNNPPFFLPCEQLLRGSHWTKLGNTHWTKLGNTHWTKLRNKHWTKLGNKPELN